MDTEAIRVRIEAVTSGLNAPFREAREFVGGAVDGMKMELKSLSDQAKLDTKNYEGTVEQFGNVVQNRFKGVNSAIKGVQTAWAQLAVVAAAGLFAQKMVTETVQMTMESQKLARALNVSAKEASVLSLAIGDVYGSTDQYIALVQGLNRQLRTNEEAIKSMGIATRDVNGEYRDQQAIVMDSLAALRSYKEGTDRNLAAQQMFGKGVDVTNEMLALNEEGLEAARIKADELGLSLSQDNVEAVNKYRAAMNDAGDVIDGMVKTLGDALIPVFTELVTLFAEYGPEAILVVRGAIGGLVSVFHGLSLMVKIVFSIMKAFFQSVADYAGAFGKMWNAIFSGDFDAALAARDELWDKLKNNANEAFSQISADASETRDKIFNLFTAGVPSVTPVGDGEGKGFKGYEKPGKDNSAAEAKKAAAEAERLRKEEFQAFKEQKDMELELTEKTYAERLRIAREVAEKAKALFGEESSEYRKASMEIIQIEREKAAEIKRIKEIQKQAALDASLAEIAAKEQEAQYLYQLHQVSAQELIGLQASFEEERYQLELGYLQERLKLMDVESEGYAQMLADIENLKAEHDLRMREFAMQAGLDQQQPMIDMFASMKQGMAETVAQLITGQMTMRQALQAIWKQMLTSFTQFLTQKLAASKLFAALEIGVNKMIAAVLRILGIQGATQAITTKSGETTAKIGQSAAVAGAGAAESQASIPYIGPILAIAAMAAIFAAVMGMKSKSGSTASAEGGFDIPRGINPLTQLHEEEMVLPKEQAEAIRNMKDSQQSGMVVNIDAVDGAGVERLFRNHPKQMAEGMRTLQRRGVKS